jgi:hypothetical protein
LVYYSLHVAEHISLQTYRRKKADAERVQGFRQLTVIVPEFVKGIRRVNNLSFIFTQSIVDASLLIADR